MLENDSVETLTALSETVKVILKRSKQAIIAGE